MLEQNSFCILMPNQRVLLYVKSPTKMFVFDSHKGEHNFLIRIALCFWSWVAISSRSSSCAVRISSTISFVTSSPAFKICLIVCVSRAQQIGSLLANNCLEGGSRLWVASTSCWGPSPWTWWHVWLASGLGPHQCPHIKRRTFQ